MQLLMKTRQRIVVFALCALIVAAIAALVLIPDSGTPVRTTTRRAPLVNEQPMQTARRIASLATTREEQRFAQQALRLADHAVDLAFAETLREVTLQQEASTPEAKALFGRVSRAEAQVKSDQELIDSIKKKASGAGQASIAETQKQLDLIQAQLELDRDDLDDAKLVLLRSAADPLSRVQRQFARYQAAQQQNDASPAQAMLPDADASLRGSHLLAKFSAWRTLRGKAVQLRQARDEVLQEHEKLQQKRESLEQSPAAQSSDTQAEQAAPAAGQSQDAMVIAMLRRLSEHHKNVADLNRRIQDHQDLADVYGSWLAFVQSQQRASVYGIIQAVLLILLIVLVVYLADLTINRFLIGLIPDRRRMRTLQVVARFVVQAVGILLIILVLVGVPNQMPTILGLAGAGLTVALKDFIVAFFGWFALMGRNGIRVGDWVEIEGVVGEVAEISLLRTVLLETGNWNDAGHPTGRKVAFINSYAIEGHYFNFSTSGQWLWDELQILVPSTQDPYPILESIRQLVVSATEEDVHKAEEEWQRVTRRERIGAVSAAPAINLRPTTSGVEIHVRYVTRAQERYATRTKLYQELVALLHQNPSDTAMKSHAS
jgi:small-conductance mechanosensitive channel